MKRFIPLLTSIFLLTFLIPGGNAHDGRDAGLSSPTYAVLKEEEIKKTLTEEFHAASTKISDLKVDVEKTINESAARLAKQIAEVHEKNLVEFSRHNLSLIIIGGITGAAVTALFCLANGTT